METLMQEGGNELPYVYCDAEKGLIELKGYSVTENPREDIYEPIILWLKEYSKQPHNQTKVNIELEYFNTSSSVCILEIFRILESLHNTSENTNVSVMWHYYEEDEDMADVIDAYRESLRMPFEKKIYEEEEE